MRVLPVLLCVLNALSSSGQPWNHELWLGNGGLWEKRFTINVSNQTEAVHEGSVVTVRIGDGASEAPLAGADIRSIRVVNAENTQLLFNLWKPDLSEVISEGAVPRDALLTLPLVCGAGESAAFTVYFDNSSAWGLADFLQGRPDTPLNGDFENGESSPIGWFESTMEPRHRLSLCTDSPYKGGKCIRQIAEPGLQESWSGYYRDGIRVTPGANCKLKVRVRTGDLKGQAGWFIHAGNRENSQILNRHATLNRNSPEWQELVIPFTVPADATTLRTGSLLRGSGTAWFDDLRIESDRPLSTSAQVTITCGAVEKLQLAKEGADAAWIDPPDGVKRWNLRFPVNVIPSEGKAENEEMLVVIETDTVTRDIHSPVFKLVFNGKEISTCRIAENLLFKARNKPGTLQTYYLYAGESEKAGRESKLSGNVEGSDIPSDQLAVFRDHTFDIEGWRELLAGDLNLIKNPDFEIGSGTPQEWEHSGDSGSEPLVRFGRSRNALLGEYSAECVIGEAAKPGWYGWRQAVSVKPGATYLFGGWMQTENFAASAQLHAHINPKSGTKAKTVFLSAGRPLSGTSGWTPMFSTVTVPRDYDRFSLHLTSNCTGTMRHDGFFMAECLPAAIGEAQSVPQREALVVWQANPVVKTFRESLPPQKAEPARLFMARNESEPLQLALRSGRDFADLRIEVSPPVLKRECVLKRFFRSLLGGGKNSGGNSSAIISSIEIGRVDYVPIDAKSCYSNCKTPEWEFKFPRQKNGSDGWPGWWPDPIMPATNLMLKANQTQPLWITFNTDANTGPGLYQGIIRVLDGSRCLLEKSYTIKVWDFEIPQRPDFPAIYDVRFKNTDFSNWRDRNKAREKILRFMAAKKLSPDTVQSHIPLKRDEEGKVVCDFTEYDEACRLYFDELQFKVSYMPHNFNVFGWGHPPRAFLGEEPYEGRYPYSDADHSNLRPEYRRVYQEALRLYWNHIKAKGWSKHFVLYISDEPHFSHAHIVRQMQALCKMIHEVDPAIRIYSSTWRHCPEWDSSIDLWGVGHYGCFPVEQMQRQKELGNEIWFTTDGQMCTDTPLLATERMLPHYAFKYGADAYEFWGVSWYTYNPWKFGWHSYIRQSSTPGEHYFVRYPDGDGYLIYPPTPETGDGTEPVTSIRIEAARDGVEDWCYLQKLVKLAELRKDDKAKALLDEFLSFSEIPNAGGRYAGRNLSDPDRLMQLRVCIGEAIERLEK